MLVCRFSAAKISESASVWELAKAARTDRPTLLLDLSNKLTSRSRIKLEYMILRRRVGVCFPREYCRLILAKVPILALDRVGHNRGLNSLANLTLFA